MTQETSGKKDTQRLQRAIIDGLEDVKAQDIQVFNTEHLSPLFERVIVASGTSNRQTKALAASVRDAVREAGFTKPRIEGEDNGEWIIVDCGAAVAHIMQPAIRTYYHLEEIWGDKPIRLKLGAPKPAAPMKAAPAKAAPAKKKKADAAPSLRRSSAAKKGQDAVERAAAEAAQAARKAPAKKASAKGGAKAASAKKAAAPARQAASKAPVKAPAKAAAKPAAKTAAKSPARTAAKAPAKTTSGKSAPAKR